MFALLERFWSLKSIFFVLHLSYTLKFGKSRTQILQILPVLLLTEKLILLLITSYFYSFCKETWINFQYYKKKKMKVYNPIHRSMFLFSFWKENNIFIFVEIFIERKKKDILSVSKKVFVNSHRKWWFYLYYKTSISVECQVNQIRVF